MELKWTLFSERMPDSTQVYVTDFVEVWVKKPLSPWHMVKFEEGKHSFAWAEIPIPETPKKEWHFCENKDGSIECYEREKGLRMVVKIREAEWMQSNFPVKFCPFCGYKPEVSKKE